ENVRPLDAFRPREALRPVGREPRHRALEARNRHALRAVEYKAQATLVSEDAVAHLLTPHLGGGAVKISDCLKAADEVHGRVIVYFYKVVKCRFTRSRPWLKRVGLHA